MSVQLCAAFYSYSPEIDVGQIEGAIVMALGMFFNEEIKYTPTGQMIKNSTWVCIDRDVFDFRLYFHRFFLNIKLLVCLFHQVVYGKWR